MGKQAIIIGSGGQDGLLLSELLSEKGYGWMGLARHAVHLGGIEWHEAVDITDAAQMARVIGAVRPDEAYHLAAYHHAAEGGTARTAEVLRHSLAVNVLSLGCLLEAVRNHSPATRVFYASSSHVFGEPSQEPQDEQTLLAPTTPYGISKAAGLMLCRVYRRQHGVFAAAGILYNHESRYRPARFVSSRIVDGALAIQRGERQELVLGRLDAEVDWGYAPEYVEAMHRIVQQDAADDFVVATGRKHSVRDFAAAAFAALGLDWRAHVREDPSLPLASHRGLVGDSSRLAARTRWRAQVVLPELAQRLVQDRGPQPGKTR